jgi:PAS domain S-box-containing protein
MPVNGLGEQAPANGDDVRPPAEDFFREAFAHAAVGMAVTDLAGRFLQVNPAYCAITGYAEAELLATDFLALTHPDDRAENLRLRGQLLAGAISDFDIEKRCLRKDGAVVWMLNSVSLRRDGDGRPTHCMALCQDVSERRRAEQERDRLLVREREARAEAEAAVRVLEEAREALRAGEEQYRSLADLIPGVVWTARADGGVNYANQFWFQFTGMTLEQTRGWGWTAALHADDVKRVLRVWKRAVRGGEPVEVEYRLRRADGVYRWFLARGRPRRDPDGRVVQWFGMLTDIEDQKQLVQERAGLLWREQQARAEVEAALGARDQTLRALRASEEQYRTLAEVMPQCIWTAGPDGQTDYVNQHWCEFSGLTGGQSLGAGWAAVLHPDDRARCFAAWSHAVGTGTPFESEYRMRRTDGVYRWFLGRGLPVRDPQGRVVKWLGTATDIDDRKSVEEELRQTRAEAVLANGAKSEFLSRMSHELRTPLNAILGFAQLLEMGAPTPRQRQHVAQILKGGRHLLELIDEVLDLARIEAGQVALLPEPLPVRRLFAEVVDLIRPLAERRGVRLAEPAGGPDVYVLADDRRLRQVLLNLVSNAVKYNREQGGVSLAVEELPAGRVRLLVRDTGPGLTPEQQQRLFNAFDRLGAEATGVEGTGLGLVVSKRLTEAMGGALGVVSTTGTGSTFFVELPAAPGRTPPSAESAGPAAPAPAAAPRVRAVLYVEDNLDNLALVEEVLAYRPQVRLLSAVRGGPGLDLARQHLPDLILLDVHLPDLKGDEVLRQLRADPQLCDTPVIVLSADATPDHVGRLRAAGAWEYLSKPIDVAHFLGLLDRYLQEGEVRP